MSAPEKGKQQSMALCHLKTVKSVRATGLYDVIPTSHVNIIYEKHKPAFVRTQILSVFALLLFFFVVFISHPGLPTEFRRQICTLKYMLFFLFFFII